MINIDRKTGKVWIEATVSDEFASCHHALFELTDELRKLISEMYEIAEAGKSTLDYVSKYVFIDVEFFEDEDSEETMRTEGTTLHVNDYDFWFSAWLKNGYLRVETLSIPITDVCRTESVKPE